MNQGPDIARGGLRSVALLCVLATVACASAVSTARGVDCPNEAFRDEQGVASLPTCMALEMVSPPAKVLQPAFWPSFSLSGERVLYKSLAALAETQGMQTYRGDHYVASRSATAWASAPTSPPAEARIRAGGAESGGPYAFSPNLGSWVLAGVTQSQLPVGVAQLFRGGLDGSLMALSPLLITIDDSGSEETVGLATSSLSGTATASDLSTTVFRVYKSSISLFDEDPSGSASGEPGGDRNSYVAFLEDGKPRLELLARDGSGEVYGGRCGAHTGGDLGGGSPLLQQGAISADGSRILLSTRPGQGGTSPGQGDEPPYEQCDPAKYGVRILERLRTPSGPEITELTPRDPNTGDDLYQAASQDGTKVYFTTPRELAASDADGPGAACSDSLGASKGCDLYLYDATLPPGERLVQVSAGEPGPPTPGAGADVLSVITVVSGDGSHAYFVAQDVLTPAANPEGDTAVAGQPNLYLYERDAAHPGGHTAFIGTLTATDAGQLWGTNDNPTVGAYAAPTHGPTGGDGHVLAFASTASLTPDDLDGGRRDVFRYDAEAVMLERITKEAPGGADDGPFDVAVNPAAPAGGTSTNFGEGTRWVGEDGETIGFTTAERLDPADEDGLPSPYVWREGQLGGAPAESDEPPAVSPPGNELAFSTETPLLPQDRDTVRDVYVARTDGGFPPPKEDEVDCTPPLCQGGAPALPGLGPNGTVGFVWSPKAAIQCRKGLVKKHGKCVKKKHRHRKAKRPSKSQGGD
jgi:hypothetical protein